LGSSRSSRLCDGEAAGEWAADRVARDELSDYLRRRSDI